MYRPGLFDGCFPSQWSATFGGENEGLSPQLVKWQRNVYGAYSTFYTDMCLDRALDAPGLRIAWLLEPPSLSDTHYKKAMEMEDIFDYILTFDTRLLNRGDKWIYYPLGGSWVKDWGLSTKCKQVSIIVSEKMGSCGHRLRHAIAQKYGNVVDVMGRGYQPIQSKRQALSDYRYSVVIESIRMDAYFSEKLIDCMSQGTIPIYWGCPSINDFFDSRGIIPFGDIDELGDILASIGTHDYQSRLWSAKENMNIARMFSCVEDYLCLNYSFLFGGKQ